MAPSIPPRERLVVVATTAARESGRLGDRGTGAADVAAKAGLSSGSVFNYVASKEALSHLVFLHGFGYLAESFCRWPHRPRTRRSG